MLGYLRRITGLTAAFSLGVLGLTVLPAEAGPGTAAGPLAGAAGRVNRSNVGATHSPQVLHELAGPDATGPMSSRLLAPMDSTGLIQGAVQGVDIASFQHPGGAAINWADVAAAGKQFAAIKATEGAYYQNPYAPGDISAAQAAGLSVIAYDFAIPNGNGASSSAVDQANYLLSYLGTASSTVPIMLDIEYDPYVSTDGTNQCYGLTQSAMVSWISAFSAQIRSKTGRLPIIYTPASWWHTCTGDSTTSAQTPLWVPDYTVSASPALPTGWGNWSFWQYSSSGTVNGIATATDLDQLNPAVIALLDPGNQQSVAGSPVRWQLNRADPVTGQTPSFSATGLPTGVSVSAGGQVTGWPGGVPGTHPVKVTVTDGQGDSGAVSFSWTVQPAPDTGPAGPIRLDLGGKCLTTVGASSANGTRADIWTCTGGTGQRWTVAADDTLRIGGKCLNVYHSGTAAGTPVNLYTCNGGKAQQWRLGTGGHLVTASGMCLADPGASTTNGTRVQLASCTSAHSTKWTLPAGPVASQIPGKCMNDTGNASTNGTPIELSTCNGTAAQAWTAEPDDTFRIHGKCLDTSDSGTTSGTPMDLNTCNGAATQLWHVNADGAGISLVNSASGLCLADPADATASGTKLQIVSCSAGDPGMAWRAR